MKKTKKIIIGTLSICIIAALGIGGTMAFLTDSEQVTNNFSVGDFDITIDESDWDDDGDPGDPDDPDKPETPGDGENLVPGDSRDKNPTVKAVEGNGYMRAIVTIKDRNTGEIITDDNRLDLILKTIRYAENKDDIKEGTKYSLADIEKYGTVNTAFTLDEEHSENGIYYYNYNGEFLKGNEAVLFTDIVIPTDWNQNHLDVIGEYQISIQAQAIQSNNFSSQKEAFEALDGEINALPDMTAQQNYGTVGGDSDKQFVMAGKTVNP